MSAKYVTRIAPTPSGYIHAGNELNFLRIWEWAKSEDAKVILRIDDLDRARYRRVYVEYIFRRLNEMGIDYDEGPRSLEALEEIYSQHLRLESYHRVLSALRAHGLLYACRCSRKEIREASVDGLYPGTCRALDYDLEDEGVAWRINVPPNTVVSWKNLSGERIENVLDQTMGDFVVLQKNGFPSYQIASLADDERMGITHIFRGQDLVDSTAAQLFLAEKLGFEGFLKVRFEHHELVLDAAGKKLSKSGE